jgi:peptidoglycan hydrolase CwlO-like protein
MATIAAFVIGVYVGGSILHSRSQDLAVTIPAVEKSKDMTARALALPAPVAPALTAPSSAGLAKLEHELEVSRNENHVLQQKLHSFDQNLSALNSKVASLTAENQKQAQEHEQTRAQLADTKNSLSQAEATIQSDQATITGLQIEDANREAQLADVKGSLNRERQMLSADREIRDIMTARDLHMVDVVDTDGKGRVRKAFGRAFYTQGKSLIFYAYDLPANKIADGRFVYAAWGSNSNKLREQKPLSLGIFYSDDQSQHRWVMKFEDPRVLQEIDTVFVTLEPEGRPFTLPSGKPILDAYFGTPPNHP